MKILPIAAFVLGLTLTNAAPADDDDASDDATVEQLVQAVEAQIDIVQHARDSIDGAPDNFVAVEHQGEIFLFDRREMERTSLLVAALVHEIIATSPTAASLLEARIGNTIGSALEGYGFGSGVADFVGSLAGEVASSAATSISEEQLQSQITASLWARLDEEARPLTYLDDQLTLLWAMYDGLTSDSEDGSDNSQTIGTAGQASPGATASSAQSETITRCTTSTFSEAQLNYDEPNAIALLGVRIPLFLVGGDYHAFGNAHLTEDAPATAMYKNNGDSWSRTNCDLQPTGNWPLVERDDPPNPVTGVSFENRPASRFDLQRGNTIYQFTD